MFGRGLFGLEKFIYICLVILAGLVILAIYTLDLRTLYQERGLRETLRNIWFEVDYQITMTFFSVIIPILISLIFMVATLVPAYIVHYFLGLPWAGGVFVAIFILLGRLFDTNAWTVILAMVLPIVPTLLISIPLGFLFGDGLGAIAAVYTYYAISVRLLILSGVFLAYRKLRKWKREHPSDHPTQETRPQT